VILSLDLRVCCPHEVTSLSSWNVPATLNEKFNALLAMLFLQGGYEIYFNVLNEDGAYD
jgi:hypothetical protein